MGVPVAQALPPVAQALPPGCAGSVRFLQKQSQLLVLGLGLDLDWNGLGLEFDKNCINRLEVISANKMLDSFDLLLVDQKLEQQF